jgi:protein phosphatase
MSEARSSVRLRPVAAGLTDVGRQRKHNEDHILVKSDLGLFAVADGMGGHNAGDVASRLTTTSLLNFFEATTDFDEIPEEFATAAGHPDPAARRLVAGVKKANKDVFVISATHAQHHGMGSTIVAVFFHIDKMYVGHVGDSRCYRVRDGKLDQLTRDHSLINDAIDLKPDLTEEELARLPRNIITRALGMKEQVKVDLRIEETKPGDVFLLCSDGLSGMVSDQHILEILTVANEPKEVCEILISEANEAGGTDNISALIIRIDEAPADAVGAVPAIPAPPPSKAASVAPPSARAVSAVSASSAPRPAATTVKLPSIPPTPKAPMMPMMPGAKPVAPAAKASAPAPTVEAGPSIAVEEALSSSVSRDVVERLERGEEVELDVAGPWSRHPLTIPRCEQCRHEIYPGNQFCVECGAKLSVSETA